MCENRQSLLKHRIAALYIVQDQREVLRIDAPEWFAMPAFREALDRGTLPSARRQIATFHRHGAMPNESSDVFILFEAREEVESDDRTRWIVESSDLLDEPGLESLYKTVARITRERGIRRGMLWLTNVGLVADR